MTPQKVVTPELQAAWPMIPPEMLARMADEATPAAVDVKPDEPIEILPQNAAAWRLFLNMGTQWRTASFVVGMRASIVKTGLVYEAMPVVAAALNIVVCEDTLMKLRVLEDEASIAMVEAQAA